MNITLKPISYTDTYHIRHLVLWPDKPIEHVKVSGDESAIHIGAFINDKHVGVTSLFIDNDQAQFRKLAVLPEFQGYGIGSVLIKECITIAKNKGVKTLWCDARQDATRFYEKLGFIIDPEVFTKSDILYQNAIMQLLPQI